MSPREAAEQLHRRLSDDPTWAGSPALPSLERIEATLTHLYSEWPIGGDPRLEMLQMLIESGLDNALGGPPAGRPAVVIDRSTDQFTARVHEPEGCGPAYLIISHAGFFTYLSLISRAVAACLPTDFLERPYDLDTLGAIIDNRILMSPGRTVFSFAEAAVCLAIDGHPDRAGSEPVDLAWWPMTKVLWDATDLFVLGHEYAHYELGHDGPRRPALDRLGAAHTRDPFHIELQADELGLSISAWALHRSGLPYQHASLGAWVTFAALLALELATCILGTGSRDEGEALFEARQDRRSLDDYPSTTERKSRLYRLLLDHAGGHDQILTQLWDGSDLAFDRLKEYTAAHAQSVVERGERPHPSRWPPPWLGRT